MLITRGLGLTGTGSGEVVYVPILSINVDAAVVGNANVSTSISLPIFSSNDTDSLVPRITSDSVKTDVSTTELLPKLTTS